ncbi:phage tail tape measure protein [Pseudomonas cichorii]|nr:phage tail tape measure protein [Pseudomonas cichorii]MBX8492019.1 phage tail tape measure protein [Pseudomonas cichorii]MBX8512085.1 phage tail tape measure protein [Pseudomonas cichorii]MBX8522176.1 phage tail tape measure protein [Pseudomonas cichorii]MBX8527065.1 phage tail tape measure protein [Pseudomonas cichorii]MBX8536946.1 phage tail tape measure protein [Pseudomonas cichorii]
MANPLKLETLFKGVDELSPALANMRKNVDSFKTGLEGSGLGNIDLAGVIEGNALTGPLIAGVKAAIGFETSMANVKKVVAFETPQQFRQMGTDILDLSETLPETANGIAAIVATGAKASLPREELTAFASDAVKMGIAFGQTGAESGEMMAKWRSSLNLTGPEVKKLSEQINTLGGNDLEKEIATMVTAMAPLGAVAGKASREVAVMGATLAGMDVPADVATTGVKSLMKTLTEGGPAKAGAFKELQLDIDQLSKGMQTDPSGTIDSVLSAISKVDPAKQGDVVSSLFGAESLGAITPLLKNLDGLKANFAKVAEGAGAAGSIEQEFADNSRNTAVAIQQMQNRMDRLGTNIGGIFLPAINDAIAVIGPMISMVAALAAEHPEVIKGVVGAAIGFGVLQVAVLAATNAARLFSMVIGLSPVAIAVRVIALAAGALIANWSSVAPFFTAIWESIKGAASVAWDWLKAAFDWTPLGMIAANWQPLADVFSALWGVIVALSTPVVEFFKGMFDWSPQDAIATNWQPLTEIFSGVWEGIKASALAVGDVLKTIFDWSPLGVISANWQSITEFFGGIWEGIKAPALAVGDVLKTMFEWSPLGLITERWEPIRSWFTDLWSDVKSGISSALSFFRGGEDGVLQGTTKKLNEFAESQRVRNAGPGGGTGALLMADAVNTSQLNQQGLNAATGVPSTSQLLAPPNPLEPGSLLMQGAAANRRLEGELSIRFDNAPAGMRPGEVRTNQPGLTISPSVGYRTIGGAGYDYMA